MRRIQFQALLWLVAMACADPTVPASHRELAPENANHEYGDAGTYPENSDGTPNTNVSGNITHVSTAVGMSAKSGSQPALFNLVSSTEGWFNSAKYSSNATATHKGTTQSLTFNNTGIPTWVGLFDAKYDDSQFQNLSITWCGSSANATTVHTVWWHVPIPFSQDWGTESEPSVAPTDTTQSCAPPKPKMLLTFGATSGTDIDVSLPEGQVAEVTIDGSGSGPGQDGGPAVSSYDWKVASTDFGGDESFSTNFVNSKSVSLTVTDADNVTASQSGSVTVDTVNPCDDPLTRTIEDCTTNPPSDNEAVSYGGSGSEPGTYQGGGGGSTYVCYVHDWFDWNGSSWIYDDTTIDYCTFE